MTKSIRSKTLAAVTLLGCRLLFTATSAHATVVDLSNSDSGSVNGAQFVYTPAQPTGTGVIQPFLRVQANGTEQGYNTSGGTPLDDKAGPWTHDVQYSDLAKSTVTLGGASYFKLLLDVNEPGGSKSKISLDSLQFYTSATGSQTTTNIASLGTLRYNLDAGGDNQVIFDASRNSGSGSGDAYIYVPVSNFAGTKSSDYIYMYALFGQGQSADTMSNADGTQGGFEEFAIVNNVTPVPELSALFPIVGLMAAVVSTNVLRRRRLAQANV